MALKGKFVDDVTTQDPDFASASKGQISDKSLGSLFSNAGSMLEDGIKLVDRQFKDSIGNKVNDFMENMSSDQDPNIMALSAEGVPDEVSRGVESMVKMSKAYGKGLISDTQWFMRTAALSSKLKSQYPGHKETVDAAINQARGTSANRARSMLMAKIDQLATSQEKQAASKDKALKKLMGEGFITPKEYGTMDRDRAELVGLSRKGDRERLTRNITDIKDKHALNEISDNEAAKRLGSNITGFMDQVASPFLRKVFPDSPNGATFNQLATKIITADFENMPTEQKKELFTSGNQLLLAVRQSVRNTPAYTALNSGGKEKVEKDLDNRLEDYEKALQSKDFNAFGIAAKVDTMEMEDATRAAIDASGGRQLQVNFKVLDNLYGAGSSEAIEGRAEMGGSVRQVTSRMISLGQSARILEGNTSLSDSFKLIKDQSIDKDVKVEAISKIIEGSLSTLNIYDPSNPKFNNTAKAMFVDNPNSILQHWKTQEQKIEVVNKFLSPKVRDKLLASEHAGAYQLWAASAVSAVTAADIGEMNSAVTTEAARKYWAPKPKGKGRTDAFSVRRQAEEDRDSYMIEYNAEGAFFHLKNTSREEDNVEASKAVRNVNRMLQLALPVMKGGNTKMSDAEAARLLLDISNMKFNETPWSQTMVEGVWATIDSLGEKIKSIGSQALKETEFITDPLTKPSE